MPIANIVLRSSKSTPLTLAELDNNFRELELKKVDFLYGANIPKGNSSQRGTTNLTVGAIRLNSELGFIEGYYNDGWRKLGATGYKGSAAYGYNGSIGYAGSKGGVGPVGATGPTGPTGPMGTMGATGPTGYPGVQGPPGDSGSDGGPGVKGVTGYNGSIGPAASLSSNAAPRSSTGLISVNAGLDEYSSCLISSTGTIRAKSINIHRSDFVSPSERLYVMYRTAPTEQGNLFTAASKNIAALGANLGGTNGLHGWVAIGVGSYIRFEASSDYRVKCDIEEESNSLEKLQQLNMYEYTLKETGKKEIGFIAHELQKYFPFSVTGYKDEVDENNKEVYQRINMTSLIPILVSSIKELTLKLERLKNGNNIFTS